MTLRFYRYLIKVFNPLLFFIGFIFAFLYFILAFL